MLFFKGKKHTEEYTDDELYNADIVDKLIDELNANGDLLSEDLKEYAEVFGLLKTVKEIVDEDMIVIRKGHGRDWDVLRELLDERQLAPDVAPVPALARHSPGDDSGSDLFRKGERIRKTAPHAALDLVCGNEVKRYLMDEGEWTIGRWNPDIGDIDESSQPDIKLKSEHVSRRHATIISKKGRFYIEDLGSTNGTTINGKPVTSKTELKSGDKIQVGDVVLEFLNAEELQS